MIVLFSDVRGFTAVSERLQDRPQELTHLMNRLLTPLTVYVMIEVPVAVVALVLAALGLALPTRPFFGTLQAAFVLGMAPFGVPQEAAVAASFLYRLSPRSRRRPPARPAGLGSTGPSSKRSAVIYGRRKCRMAK